MANDVSDLDRRMFLAGTGVAMSAPLLATSVPASATHFDPASPSVFGKSGNFDLDNPRDRLLARIKVNSSLTGERVFLWNMTRHMFCEPGKVPYQILAELELMTIWTGPPAEGESAGKIGALFTRIPLDPLSFTPITSYDNPYTGRTIPLEHTMFGGSGLPVDPDDPEPNIVFQQNSPHYRMGDNLVIVNYDPEMQEGPIQPKVDTAALTANYADVMDPTTGAVECDYSFSAFFPAGRYRWSDVPEEDEARIFTLKVGRKVLNRADLPAEFQRSIVALYPDRV